MIIQLNKINKTYNNGNALHVLKNIDLSIHQGEMVSIMGHSGSGKTTLLNILGILDTYDSGEYILNGRLIKQLDDNEAAQIRNQLVGFVFQSFNLISHKNAMENVALPLYYQNIKKKERNKIAMQYLQMMGMEDRALHMPNELSGGQKQRVAIARALVTQPKIILADEPTGALDSSTTIDVMNLLKQVNKQGMTIIIVTHEQSVAQCCDKIIDIKDGYIESIEIVNSISKNTQLNCDLFSLTH